MSFVGHIESGKSIRSVLSLLDDVTEWTLVDKGKFTEKFIHTSGWQFYTGVSFCTLSNDRVKIDVGFLRWLWFKITKKEEKFVKAWLYMNKLKEE